MKFLFLILSLISFEAMACKNMAPISAIEQYMGSEPVPGVTCEERPKDECLCFDHIESWSVAEIVDNYVNGEPKYGPKENVAECKDKEACEALRFGYCDKFPEHSFFYAENLILPGYEAYCTKIVGYEQVLSGKKVINNPDKLAALKSAKFAKAEQAKTNAEKKRLAIERIRQFSTSGLDNATTVAGVKAAVKAALIDIVEILK